MTPNCSVRSAAPDELEVRLARIGLPARGAQDRQATLLGPLQAFHRALLGAFLTEAGPPDLAAVAGWQPGGSWTRRRRWPPWPPPTSSMPTRPLGGSGSPIPSPDRPLLIGWS